jgi:MFS family permease
MKRGFYTIMAAQFFSSLADNALFIAAIALIQQIHGPAWMTPMMKWVFAVSYVVLAAYVGAFADALPKGRVMFITNTIKVAGCLMMLLFNLMHLPMHQEVYVVFAAYALVGIGAAAYSPAKYGILTELLPAKDLVKGNGWIEALTVLSIIFGTVLGGLLIHPKVASKLLAIDIPMIETGIDTPAQAALVVITCLYVIAAIFNLAIPDTGAKYPRQERRPIKLLRDFSCCVTMLWRDKLGQISLAVTTLFWGAGVVLQLIVIEWGKTHLGLSLSQASMLMGVASVGTIMGAVLAGTFVTLRRSLSVLPVGIAMGLVVMLMPLTSYMPVVYVLLIAVGGLGGFFVVPMNALLQHRGHLLLSAGHSIAAQNFNEQLNILVMVAVYSVMLGLGLHINIIIVIFGVMVASLMLAIMRWNKLNHARDPGLDQLIGQDKH